MGEGGEDESESWRLSQCLVLMPGAGLGTVLAFPQVRVRCCLGFGFTPLCGQVDKDDMNASHSVTLRSSGPHPDPLSHLDPDSAIWSSCLLLAEGLRHELCVSSRMLTRGCPSGACTGHLAGCPLGTGTGSTGGLHCGSLPAPPPPMGYHSALSPTT